MQQQPRIITELESDETHSCKSSNIWNLKSDGEQIEENVEEETEENDEENVIHQDEESSLHIILLNFLLHMLIINCRH